MRKILFALVFVKILHFGQIFYANHVIHHGGFGSIESFLRNLANYHDGRIYISISNTGYIFHNDSALPNYAFFPLFPLLLHLLRTLFGESLVFVISLLAINTALSVCAGLVLSLALRRNYGEEVAFWTPLLILSCPTAVYFDLAYTESLYFFITASILWLLGSPLKPLVIPLGILGGLSRPQGVALSCLSLHRPRESLKLRLLFVAAPLVGFLAFALYVGISTGSPFEIITVQRNWGRFCGGSFLYTGNKLDVAYLVLSILCLLLGWRYLLAGDWIFLLISVLIPLATGSLLSFSRYCLVIYPLYILIAIATISAVIASPITIEVRTSA